MAVGERPFGLGNPESKISETEAAVDVSVLKKLFPKGFTLVYFEGEQFDQLNQKGTETTSGKFINIFDWSVPQPFGGNHTIDADNALKMFLVNEDKKVL